MATYTVKAVDEKNTIVALTQSAAAKDALITYRDALPNFRRVWACDGSGAEISPSKLLRLAWEQRGNSL